MKQLAILCSGDGSNLQVIVDAAASGRLRGAQVAVVISDNPQARALARAQSAGIPVAVLESLRPGQQVGEQLLPLLRTHQVDIVILAGFMRILSTAAVAAYRHKILNIHPALLPAFPGAHAVSDALEHGAKITGVTIHLVDEGIDTGPIVLQEAVPIHPGDDQDTVLTRVHAVEHRLYPEAIQLLVDDRLQVSGRHVTIAQPS